MKRLVLSLSLVALAVVAAACSGGPGGSIGLAATAPAGAISVTAKDIKFTTPSITAPAGEAFQIFLDNQDSAPHNVAIKDGSGTVAFKGELVTSTQVTYDVAALAAGTYEFYCEVHPEMKGTLTAK